MSPPASKVRPLTPPSALALPAATLSTEPPTRALRGEARPSPRAPGPSRASRRCRPAKRRSYA
jgi:hypothetical protein